LGAEAKSGDLLDMASQAQALDEAQSVSQEHPAAEEHVAAEDQAAAVDHAAEPILNSETNASGAQPTQTSTFSPESK
jgi:hypothetical protein